MSFFYQHYSKDLKDGEELVTILHKHPLTLAKPMFKVALWGLLPVLILLGFLSYGNSSLWLQLGFFVVLVSALSYGFFEWFTWYNDVYILTNEKIINIEQNSLFHRTVSETTWDKVQDVTFEVKGVLSTLFDFGSIHVQTAGAKDVIEFTSIAHPEAWQKKLMEIQKVYEDTHKDKMSADELVKFVLDAQEKAAEQNLMDIKKI